MQVAFVLASNFQHRITNEEPLPRLQVPTVADASSLVLGYAFVHAGLVYTVMSFACESSVTVATTGAIVMNMNLQEHQDRVLVKKRPYAGRATSPVAGE
jgi:hypothetical protein